MFNFEILKKLEIYFDEDQQAVLVMYGSVLSGNLVGLLLSVCGWAYPDSLLLEGMYIIYI